MTSWFHPRKVAATQPTEGSDNRAFEEHKKEALERLQDEQRQFEEFLNELRYAKDKEEFDEFLASKA